MGELPKVYSLYIYNAMHIHTTNIPQQTKSQQKNKREKNYNRKLLTTSHKYLLVLEKKKKKKKEKLGEMCAVYLTTDWGPPLICFPDELLIRLLVRLHFRAEVD